MAPSRIISQRGQVWSRERFENNERMKRFDINERG